jgi:hypothetical protein
MRSLRVAFLLLIASVVLSSAACTNPTGPKPAGDDVMNTKV